MIEVRNSAAFLLEDLDALLEVVVARIEDLALLIARVSPCSTTDRTASTARWSPPQRRASGILRHRPEAEFSGAAALKSASRRLLRPMHGQPYWQPPAARCPGRRRRQRSARTGCLCLLKRVAPHLLWERPAPRPQDGALARCTSKRPSHSACASLPLGIADQETVRDDLQIRSVMVCVADDGQPQRVWMSLGLCAMPAAEEGGRPLRRRQGGIAENTAASQH